MESRQKAVRVGLGEPDTIYLFLCALTEGTDVRCQLCPVKKTRQPTGRCPLENAAEHSKFNCTCDRRVLAEPGPMRVGLRFPDSCPLLTCGCRP